MPKKAARELRAGDKLRGGFGLLRVIDPPKPPEKTRIHFEELDDSGNVVGTGSMTLDSDEEVDTE